MIKSETDAKAAVCLANSSPEAAAKKSGFENADLGKTFTVSSMVTEPATLNSDERRIRDLEIQIAAQVLSKCVFVLSVWNRFSCLVYTFVVK